VGNGLGNFVLARSVVPSCLGSGVAKKTRPLLPDDSADGAATMLGMSGEESKDRPAGPPPGKVNSPAAPPPQPDRTIAEPGEAALSEGRKGMVALPVNPPGDVVNQLQNVSPPAPAPDPPPPPPPPPPADSE